MSDLSSSTVRITHFRVERELGRDGLGYVFHAVDEQLERPVALRVARAGTCFSGPDIAAARTRFRDDARRAAAISHPNLVTIFEFRALTETDLMVMELVNGETLAELQERGTRWTVLETARILARLSDALAVAHEAGLVHGRVRIHNVRIRPDGRVKLLDLGVPREPVDELSGEPVFRDDVRGLARLASQMLSPIQPSTSEEAAFAALRDAVTSRARYGFLAPVLLRAIGDTATGAFANAGEFRDALVTALDAATHRATPDGRDDESKWSTRVVGPERNFAEDRLPADGRALFALGRVPPTAGRGRLVLPPDLADQVSAVPEDRLGSSIARHRRPRAPVSAKIAVLIAIVAALTAVAWVAYQRMGPSRNVPQVAIQGNGDNAPEAVAIAPETMPPLYAGPPRDAPPNGAAADSIVTSPAVAETVAVSDSPGGNAPGFQLTAMVRGSPAGTTIGVVDDPTQSWTDAVELSVAPGDTITLQFSRPGYVPQTQRFHGSRLAVELQPDSVVAAFDANTQAQVLLVTGAGERLLGTTPVQVRFPSGSFRITFRAPGQPDWTSVHNMMQPGRRYTVTKTDYVTSGDLIVSVVGTWAMVSLDGGPDRETPIRFDDLSVGAHILRITRDGFQTIVDTVMVQAGAPVTRQYTLQR
ncbi:MAG: protein kinase domain-containing protein [Longimicrobiales bacterium]